MLLMEFVMLLMIHMLPNIVLNMNLILRVIETRFLVQHKSCESKCGLNESVWNSSKNGIINVIASVKN